MSKTKELTRDVIALIIVVGTITSLFFTVNETGQNLLYGLSGVVVGYYFGLKTLPVLSAFKKKE